MTAIRCVLDILNLIVSAIDNDNIKLFEYYLKKHADKLKDALLTEPLKLLVLSTGDIRMIKLMVENYIEGHTMHYRWMSIISLIKDKRIINALYFSSHVPDRTRITLHTSYVTLPILKSIIKGYTFRIHTDYDLECLMYLHGKGMLPIEYGYPYYNVIRVSWMMSVGYKITDKYEKYEKELKELTIAVITIQRWWRRL